MVSKTNIQTNFTVPKDFNEEDRALAARLIINQIQENTSNSLDRNGKLFHKYSEQYKQSLDFKNAGKTNRVNLELSGDMMASLELVSSRAGEVTIGYKLGDSLAGQVEGVQLIQDRKFIGLPQKQLDLIIATVKNQKPELSKVTDKVDGMIENLLSRFI